ncbi:MAG TPA: peptidylprolyl isomerase [Terracidiphilus sp.]|nr:peptidylprolyl isomerase [Terracidiphilus sp.]
MIRTVAVFAFGTLLAAWPTLAPAQVNQPESPYGGSVVEDIIARVNDQIITKSDYDRAESELDQEGQQHGASMQEMATQRKDLLRNLIDQQLWLSKGKELNITGETDLVKRLDEIRKQYNLDSIDDLEKAAKEQGVSFEDFKAGIRNQIITQDVMRQEVGEHIQMTPGEVERYYEEHKQDYNQPESERLSEILISTGPDGASDPAKVAAAKAKADDIEARLHSGGDFAQLARSFSDGSTAASGGDLGEYKRGQLGKVLEDKTFDLQTGQYTDPILTRQGYIILKVVQHTPGGPRPFKDVEGDVEQAYYMTLMDPAIRAYLDKMRNEAAIWIKPGYVDTGATYAELHPSISFSTYVPPAPKKKAKVERTRFRESTHTFRDKSGSVAPPAETANQAGTTPASANARKKKKTSKKEEAYTEKPGKKEKIRFGQAPRETLPSASTNSATENAGALPDTATTSATTANPETASNTDQPANPLEPVAPTQKTRFSARAREPKTPKPQANRAAAGSTGAPPPSAAEVADQQTQSAPLGPSSDSSKKRKKTATATGEKTRLANKKKSEEEKQPKPVQQPTPIAPVAGAPAPSDHPEAPQPQQNQQ